MKTLTLTEADVSLAWPSCPKVGGWASRHLEMQRGQHKRKPNHAAGPVPSAWLLPGEFKDLQHQLWEKLRSTATQKHMKGRWL